MTDGRIAELHAWYLAAVAAAARPPALIDGALIAKPGVAGYVLSVDAAGVRLDAPVAAIRDTARTGIVRDRRRAQAVAGGRWRVLDEAIAGLMPDRRAASSRKSIDPASWLRAAAFVHLVGVGMTQRAAARTVLAWDDEATSGGSAEQDDDVRRDKEHALIIDAKRIVRILRRE